MLTQEIVSFITVLVVAVCVACSISVLYASGLRLWARADGDVGREPPVWPLCCSHCGS